MSGPDGFMDHYLAIQTIYVAVWVVLAFVIGYGVVAIGVELYRVLRKK